MSDKGIGQILLGKVIEATAFGALKGERVRRGTLGTFSTVYRRRKTA